MGRKKKKDVVRCNVCGVQATQRIAGKLHVCDNPVCEQLTLEQISAVVEYPWMYGLEQKEEGGKQ